MILTKMICKKLLDILQDIVINEDAITNDYAAGFMVLETSH